MQKRPKGWETARDDPNHIGELLVTIDGKEYAAQDIVSCEIERSLLENTAEVGNATAAVLTLEIHQGAAIPKRAKVVVQYRLALDDARTDYIPKGTYWINTREKDGCYLKLTCYDAMLMAQQDYLDDVTADDWPQQEADCAAEIAKRMGVEIDPRTLLGTGDNHRVSMPVGRTMREVLEQIAAANGGNWCITPAGKLLLVPFAGTGDVLPTVSGVPDCGDVQTITGVRVARNDTDTPLLAGDETGTVLEAENENGTQALADELAKKLVGLPYAPYTCEQRYIDPVAEAGDRITVGSVSCVAYNIKESLGPSHYADLEAPAEAGELEEEYPYQSTAERVKKQLGTVTTSVAEIRKDQQSIEAEVSKTVETVAKNTKDIEAARKEAAEKSEAAAADAKKYADDKLLEYSTTEEVKSLVSQTADNITSEVSKTYATTELVTKTGQDATDTANKYTDGKLVQYSTTEETKSLIDQRADGITQEVSKTYATKTEVESAADDAADAADKAAAAQKAAEAAETNAAADAAKKAEAARQKAEETAAADATAKADQAETNAKAAAAADATAKADQALTDAKNHTDEQLKNYSTTQEVKSLISQEADNIKLEVSETYVTSDDLGSYAKKSDIDVAVNGITLKVEQKSAWENQLGSSEWTEKGGTTAGSGSYLGIIGNDTASSKGSVYVPTSKLANFEDTTMRIKFQYKIVSAISGGECHVVLWWAYKDGTSGGNYIKRFTTSATDKADVTSGWVDASVDFRVKDAVPTKLQLKVSIDKGATGRLDVQNLEIQVQRDGASVISLSHNGVEISSDTINISGYVTFSDLAGTGTSSINGSNITTGKIGSSAGNTVYDLDAGTLRTGTSTSTRVEISSQKILWYYQNYLTGILYSEYGKTYIGCNSQYMYLGWFGSSNPSLDYGALENNGSNFDNFFGIMMNHGGMTIHAHAKAFKVQGEIECVKIKRNGSYL